jgi:hypothetical protein
LAHVRLVGPGTEEVWDSPGTGDDSMEVRSLAAEAAAWVAGRVGKGQSKSEGPVGELSLLCLDVEGSSCAWLTAPSSDPAVVTAVLAQGGNDWAGAAGAPAGGAWTAATTADASVQALAPPPVKAERHGLKRRGKPAGRDDGGRLAVLAVPDVLARLFVDELDDRGVVVERAVSLWHALGMAWDPAQSGGGSREVVATSSAVVAVVLIDPAGRLVWCWSHRGELLAAGMIKLAAERGERGERVEGGGVRVGSPEIARLTADWLSWSVQLGAAPQRIVCLGPEIGEGADGLTPAELGAALGRAWPGATVDLAVHDDPVGATLRRLAGGDAAGGGVEDARTSLVDLSRRPGRIHRSMYRWVSLAVLAFAVALLGVGWKAWSVASRAKAARAEARSEMTAAATAVAPPGTNLIDVERAKDQPKMYLEDKLKAKRQSLNPTGGLDVAPPILAELETLSYVLGTKDIHIDQMSLLNGGVMLYLSVPDTLTGESIKQSLDGIGSSHCNWGAPQWGTARPKQGQVPLTIYGKWKAEGGGAGGAGSGASASAGGRS